MASSSEDVTARFAQETAGVSDPVAEPVVGDILPPGTEAQEPEPDFPLESFITEEFVGMILSMPGKIMARRTGHEWWSPDENEVALLGKGATPAVKYLLEKYITGGTGPFAALGMVLGVVYAPKLMREQMERRAEKSSGSEQRQSYQRGGASPPSSESPGAANPTNNFASSEGPSD
jgi:hypothetical protein